MKASAAVFAVTASASAQTLTGSLSVPNAASPVFTQSSDMNSTSASNSAASLALRLLEWVTLVRKDASTSDPEPGAAAAITSQTTTTILTGDVSVVPTVEKGGERDLEEKRRSIPGGRRGGSGVTSTSTSTSTSSVAATEHPATTLCTQERQDVLRTTKKATRTTPGERSRVTLNLAGTVRGDEILDLLRAQLEEEERKTQGEPNIEPGVETERC